ncbi:MAG: c-type cytochrome [Deltaproteobacteria bacterium]|nr:c-type cytochrome [Deltaproteobacteria bacterium]
MAEWIVRRFWGYLPAAPIALFLGMVGYIGFCDPHFPCHAAELDLHLASEAAIPPDRPVATAKVAGIVDTFRYKPTGTEANAGIPYWIFKALPALFKDDPRFANASPGHEWDAFGMFGDADPAMTRASGIPRGMVLADTDVQLPGTVVGIGLKRVAFNCAACHQGEWLDDQDQRHLVDGMPNHSIDTQQFKTFIHDAMKSALFTPERVLEEIDHQLALAGHAALTRWERLVYTGVVTAMRQGDDNTGWMAKRPPNGPGRVDAFSAVKYEVLAVPDDGKLATVDLPSIWHQGNDIRPWHHWDGNTDNSRARNYGSVVGVGGSALSVRGVNVDQVAAWLDSSLGPPAETPFARKAATDPLVVRGKQLFGDLGCAHCHGTYDPATGQVERAADSSYMTSVVVDTDPRRWQAFDPGTAAALDGWGFARGIWPQNAFRPASPGYVPPPLDGIWARAPYLHNGSVPSLRALLTAPEDGAPPPRPAVFYRGSRRYDATTMGWEIAPTERGTGRALFKYDTSLDGNGNGGHAFYVADGDLDAMLAYLGTL